MCSNAVVVILKSVTKTIILSTVFTHNRNQLGEKCEVKLLLLQLRKNGCSQLQKARKTMKFNQSFLQLKVSLAEIHSVSTLRLDLSVNYITSEGVNF